MSDVLLVSLGSTSGWLAADDALCGALERAGASVALVRAATPRPARTFMLTDLGWARAARAAAVAGMRAHRPAATIYSSVTAALLWPEPGAIRFDALSAGNRPGRHGLWQRPLERYRLRQAPLLLPMSAGALAERPVALPASARERALVLPAPVEPSGPRASERDLAAITYAANPAKKGTAAVLDAWREARRPGEELVVAGCDVDDVARLAGGERGAMDGVRAVGALPPGEYRALLRRARVFVCAPRREDYGIAQLEALADGCMLVTTPAPGPYAALALARALDSRLVSADLAPALRVALDDPVGRYAERARAALAPFTRAALDRLVAHDLLPRLLGRAPAHPASSAA